MNKVEIFNQTEEDIEELEVLFFIEIFQHNQN